jgi:hypothetical protein
MFSDGEKGRVGLVMVFVSGLEVLGVLFLILHSGDGVKGKCYV